MTMPERIYAMCHDQHYQVWSEMHYANSDAYIRADIVGELARVLDDVTEVNLAIDKLPIELVEQVDSILSRINAIMEGK